MSSDSDRPDEGLGERLRELDAIGAPQDGELLGRMFADVKARCDKNDRTLTGFLRSRSTMVRRAIVLTVFSALAIVGWFAFPVVGDQARTAQWTASLVTFCVLLVVAMFMVTRPVHLPALPRWQSMCLACVAVGATIVAAFWPHPAAQAATQDPSGGIMAGACMGAGLLLGVPGLCLASPGGSRKRVRQPRCSVGRRPCRELRPQGPLPRSRHFARTAGARIGGTRVRGGFGVGSPLDSV